MATAGTHPDLDDPDGLSARANLLYALGSASRQAIVRELSRGELRVKDLASAAGLTQPNTSHQLRCLWNAGAVSREPRGQEIVYRLVPGVRELLGAADRLLATVRFVDGATPAPGSRGAQKTIASASQTSAVR